MRSLQVQCKARPQVCFGPAFCPWPTNSVSYLGQWTLGLSLKDRSESICQFNFDFNPVRKTCSWNLFEVTENDLKKCVLEIATLFQSQERVESALLGQMTPPHNLCSCTSLNLGLTPCWNCLHSFLLCFHCLGISPKCAAHQTRYSVGVALRSTGIFRYHVGGLLPFGCPHTDSFETRLPWLGST